MSVKYKYTCSICKIIFFSNFRGQNICSKTCRSTIKIIKKYRKCVVLHCNWDATIEVHHEGGKEYNLCPNHHSLLTTGKQNLQEVLAATIKSPEKPKGYICPIVDLRPGDLNDCPIINRSYHYIPKKYSHKKQASEIDLVLYKNLKQNNIKEFTYKSAMESIAWGYAKTKKHILKLIKYKKIKYKKLTSGGKRNIAIFLLC